jgi:hypothetical protein
VDSIIVVLFYFLSLLDRTDYTVIRRYSARIVLDRPPCPTKVDTCEDFGEILRTSSDL